jgi:hypothetical protein
MTEIKLWGGEYNGYSTYRGTAEGDHGVFTRNTRSDGRVYAGRIVNGYPCVGVLTWPDGDTCFVECDADGKEHGRELRCNADGETAYRLYEHGNSKEWAYLRADGTCTYKNKVCCADYAPFVALQEKVMPIKARPPLLWLPQPPVCRIFYPAIAPPVGPIGHCFGTRRSWRRPTPTRCALAAFAISLRGPCGTATCQTMHRASNLDDAPRRRVHHACATTSCVVHPSAVRARSANPHAPPLFQSRSARPRGASRPAAGCTCRFDTPRAARMPTRVAVAFRTVHLHSGPIAPTKL